MKTKTMTTAVEHVPSRRKLEMYNVTTEQLMGFNRLAALDTQTERSECVSNRVAGCMTN